MFRNPGWPLASFADFDIQVPRLSPWHSQYRCAPPQTILRLPALSLSPRIAYLLSLAQGDAKRHRACAHTGQASISSGPGWLFDAARRSCTFGVDQPPGYGAFAESVHYLVQGPV